MARSTVKVFVAAHDIDGERCDGHGSGTFVSSDGLILTNYHVVSHPACELDELTIGMTDRFEAPPEQAYRAVVLAADEQLDLAVLGVVSDLSGAAVTTSFDAVEVGSVADLNPLDQLVLIGYPAIGGSTISFTVGTVSGFSPQENVGDRAWIKTDGTIAGGSSGGGAYDSRGRLVGIPTQGGSGDEEADVVDCRDIVPDAGSCVPIGGFINALRAAEYAVPLIDRARSAEVMPSPTTTVVPKPPPFPENTASNVVVTTDDTRPAGPGEVAFPSGTSSACVHFGWQGIPDGSPAQTVRRWNDQEVRRFPFTWSLGSSGEEAYVCLGGDGGSPLADGVHEWALYVQDRFVFDVAFTVGEFEPVTIQVENVTSNDVCTLWITPAGAKAWGVNRLDGRLAPGSTALRDFVTGDYEVRFRSCDASRFDYVELGTYSITGSGVLRLFDGD